MQQISRSEYDIIGDDMKIRERRYAELYKMDASRITVVRLDGRGFSMFTRKYIQPYDSRIADTMEATSIDIMTEFHPSYIYSQSDEISVIFLPKFERNNQTKYVSLPHDGKVVKLCTVMAGFVSARFNVHLMKNTKEERSDGKVGSFDARAFQLETNEDLIKYISWRQNHDARRNGVAALARKTLGVKAILNKNVPTMIELLKQQNVDWESLPTRQKYGFFVSKEKYNQCSVNPVDQTSSITIRSRPIILYVVVRPDFIPQWMMSL